MPIFSIQAPDGKTYRVQGPDQAGAIEYLQSQIEGNKSTQPNQQPVAGDTSMGTAFKSSDLRAQSLGPKGFATVNRALEDGIVGNTLNRITDNYINPLYEKLGIEPIDRRKNTQEFTANLEAAGDKAAKAARQFEEDRGFQNLTTDDIKDIPSFVDYAQQKVAQAGAFMVPTLAMGSNPVTMTAIGYPFAVGESYENIEDLEGTLTQQQKDDYASLAGVVMSGLEAVGLSRLLPNGVSTSIIGGIADGAISEGVTEGLQELVQIGLEASAGKEFAEGEILKRLKESVAAGATVGSSIKATSNTATKLKNVFTSDGNLVDYNSLSTTEKQAGADVARLLREISTANGYNLRDTNVASEKGGKKALEAARKRIIDRLRELKKDAAIKPLLSPKQRKSLNQLLDDFAPADGAFRAANNKVSDRVTQDQYDAVMRLLPDSKEKQEIANLLRMSNQVTDLFNKGLKGGISQYTDYFNPFIKDGSYDPNRAANVIIGTGAGLTLGPVPTAGIVAGGRAFDFVTGRRAAAVDRFVRANENRPGLDAPSGTSLIQSQADAEAAAQQQTEQEAADAETARFNRRQMNLDLTKRNAEPFIESPQGRMEDATGLDRSGVAKVLRVIEATTDNPAILDAIASYKKSVAEGGKVKDLTPLIRMVNERVANNPGLVERVREPNNSVQPNVDTTGPTQPRADAEFGNQRTTPENYNRGIEDNKAFRQDLEDRVLKNPDIKGDEEKRLLTSLVYLRDNLGTSPVPNALQEIQDLEDSGVVSQENIDTYVRPYVNRIVKQQRGKAPVVESAPETQPVIDPVVESAPEAQQDVVYNKALSLVLTDGKVATSYLQRKLEIPYRQADNIVKQMQEEGIVSEANHVGKRTVNFAALDDAINQQQRNTPKLDEQKSIPDLPPIQGPVLSQTPNPLNIDTNDLAATNLNEMPSAEDIAQMREGTYKPESKRTLVEAVDYLNNKWQQATGRKEPFEYTPENVDRIASLMATEAMQALKNDGNAIGWYDRKLKAAKSVVSLVEPRVTQSPDAEAAFDFALAVTSNGQAVANNFEYALEVFRHFMDNGVMPTDTWIKGGERNNAMIEAFDFFNTYNASGQNMPVQDFLDSDFTVKELDQYIANFNEQYGTNLKVPSSEGKGTDVKGSYIIGPKIGQGFYQNIRGNYDPLTMDIWWMRMWNRLVGRPFTTQTPKAANEGRQRVREALKTKNQDALEKRLTNETLTKLGLTRASLKDQDTFDEFVIELEKNYQRFFSKRGKELKGTGKKVEKPELFLATGSLVKNITPQLQAQPKGPGERSYMRTVTKAAIEKLRQNGYMIDTADFQALMWYPEKQLFRKLGVAPGRGADNDYLDAAKMLALKEGFTDDQINQTLPPSDGDGAVSVQPGAEGQTSGVSPGTSRISQAEESRQIPALQSGDVRRQSPRASTTSPVFPKPSLKAVKDAIVRLRPAFQIGKRGSKYENGIQSIDEALELAKALGVTVELFDTSKEMQAATVLAQLPITNEGTVGAYYGGTIFNRQTFQTRTVERTSTAGTVFALAPGAESSNGTRTDLGVLTTILHELSHALTLSKIDPNVSLFDGARDEYYDNWVMGDVDHSPPGSFVNSAIKPLVMAADGGNPDNAILQEIDNLQENIEVYTTNNPQERTALRDLKRARKKLEEARAMGMSQGSIDVYTESIDDYKSYTQNSRELAVDPVLVYLLNPKLAKKLAPKTTALIRKEFEKAKDSKVQFFSHPFAVVAAVVMAMMAAKDEEDEQRRMMPPPGALNQPMQPGALSA